ncbi:MAG: hypothetical protein QOD71_2988, partial [Thermoleophilaceae bacterium]|nr:hypothetical protein [Thermoleophilaceae bacterium]
PARTVAPCKDTVKPRLSGLELGKKAFRRSTVLDYRLSEAAKVTVHVEKRTRARTHKWHYVQLSGKLTDKATAGNNEVTIRRRFAGRKLAEGRYRLVLVAKDSAGNNSVVKRIGFSIKL